MFNAECWLSNAYCDQVEMPVAVDAEKIIKEVIVEKEVIKEVIVEKEVIKEVIVEKIVEVIMIQEVHPVGLV